MDAARDGVAIDAEDVRGLARAAALPHDEGGEAALAAALETDLRAIREMRAVDAGEVHPAGVAPPRHQPDER